MCFSNKAIPILSGIGKLDTVDKILAVAGASSGIHVKDSLKSFVDHRIHTERTPGKSEVQPDVCARPAIDLIPNAQAS